MNACFSGAASKVSMKQGVRGKLLMFMCNIQRLVKI